MSEAIRESTLAAGVWFFDLFKFASGKRANNKLDIPLVLRDPAAKELLIGRMVELALLYQPDAVWGVPSGGQDFAKIMAKRLGVPLIKMAVHKDEDGTKRFQLASWLARRRARNAKNAVGIEDLTNEFTSTNRALEIPELAVATRAIVAACRRGTPETETPPLVPVEWAFEMPVPNEVTTDHPLVVEYGRLAVGKLVEL